MKKVMVLLMLVGLIAGLAQAQTLQVRKIWEKTLNAGLRGSAFDPGRLSVVARTEKGLQVFDSTGRVTLEDSAADIRGNDYMRCVFSPNGRFVGFNRYVYHKNYTQLPPPFIIDGLSGRRLLRDVCSNCEIRAISNDGQAILMAKDLSYGPEFSIRTMIGQHVTLRFCAGDGRVLRELPMYGFQEAVFSTNSKRLVVHVVRMGKAIDREHYAWDPGTIIEFDPQGNEIWRDAAYHQGWYSVSDSGDVLSIVGRDRKGYARFYDRNGRMVREIPIENPSSNMEASISADGKRGIISLTKWGVSASYLLFVESSSSTPRWVKSFNRDYVSAAISPEGDRVLVNLGPNEPLIFNAEGQALVGERYNQPTYFVLGGAGYFLAISGQKIALNQIVP